jgi:subtilisin family serine protease
MKSIVRYLFLLLACFAFLNTYAMAADYLVVVRVLDGTNINTIADAYNGKVLDSLAANTYVMDVKSLTPKYPVSGLISMDSNALIHPGRAKGGIITVKAGTDPDWYYGQPALKFIGADQAKLKATGKGVVIADINAALDYSHPALRGHLTGGYDFVLGRAYDVTLNQSSSSFLDQSSSSFLDQSSSSFLDQSSSSFLDQSSSSFLDQSSSSFLDQTSARILDASNPAHGHGTLVAGILAAVAPDAMIMPIRAFDDYGQADDFTIAKAIYWAVDHGADVINMSFGTLDKSKVLEDAVNYADKNHVTMIGSAGNDGKNEAQYPAAFDKVLSIAATDLFDVRASFSNYGDSIDISGPGVAIIAPYPGGYFAVVSGTSFSAPLAAGEAALLRSLGQKQNAKDRIKGKTHKIDQVNPGVKMGQGRIDLLFAISN